MYQRRLKLLLGLVLSGMVVLGFRLYWLCGIHGEDYIERFEQSLELPMQWLETVRGSIYDSKGRVLAIDRPCYELCLRYELTRLYDQRFWDGLKSKVIVSRRGRQEYEGMSDEALAGAWRLCQLSDRDLADVCLMSVREFRRQTSGMNDDQIDQFVNRRIEQADHLLSDLAGTCQVTKEILLHSVETVNDDIYRWQSSRARREYYRRHLELGEHQPVTGGEAILADLSDAVEKVTGRKDHWLVLSLVELERIVEMGEPQPVIALEEDTALTVEERFVGALSAGRTGDRPISVRIGKNRDYPYGDTACHLIGQMGPVETVERESDGPPAPEALSMYYHGDRQGDWGAEYVFEPILRGRRGWYQPHRKEGILERVEPVEGQDVVLTIDIELQQAIQLILAGNNSFEQRFRGAAVVIDVPTGEVAAMVSCPTFDLNHYYEPDEYRRINQQDTPEQYWCNRALMKNYQPGSTVKPTLLLGALEHDVVTMQTEFTPEKDWPDGPFDIRVNYPISAHEAIKKSCLLYFVKLGRRFGSERMVDWLYKAGFGRRILAWPGSQFTWMGTEQSYSDRAERGFRETTGDIHPTDRTYPTLGQLSYISIGRGILCGSVLQFANSMATIGRDGFFRNPVFVLSPDVPNPPVKLVLSYEHVRQVQQAMHDVVYDRSGTAFEAFSGHLWPEDQVVVHGKTGSTDYSLFGCFARAADGRCIALAVLIEADVYGSDLAAPLVQEILHCCSYNGYLPAVPTE